MMTNPQSPDGNLPTDVLIRRLVGEQVSDAPRAPSWDEIAQRSGELDPAEPKRGVLVVAATIGLIVILVGGIAVVASRSLTTGPASDAPNSSTASSDVETVPVLLGDVDQLLSGQWIVPSWMPGGFKYQFAIADPFVREASFGTVESPEQLMVTIGAGRSELDGDPVEIAGFEWSVIADDGSGWWSAARLLGSTVVTVGGSDIADDVGRRLIDGLTVVSEEALPSPPLACASQAVDVDEPGLYGVDVARFDLDGATFTFAVEDSNGYRCTIVATSTSAGSSCCDQFDPANKMTLVGGGTDWRVGNATVLLHSAGMVSLDVVRVEVDFINDVTVTVEPTDLSGEFDDTRFWVAAAEVEREPGQSAETINSPVEEVRGYDSEGALLVSRRGF